MAISASLPRSSVWAVWTWASISPGMAIWPEPSRVEVAATRRRAVDALPIQTILLPLTATAPSRMTLFRPSMVTTSQPLISRSTLSGPAMVSSS